MSETCPICRNGLNEPCNICFANNIKEACKTVTGQCGHKFHYHCIEQWLRIHHVCPACQEQFVPLNEPELLELTKTEINTKASDRKIDNRRLIVNLDEADEIKWAEIEIPDEDDITIFDVTLTPQSGTYKDENIHFRFTIPNGYPINPPEVAIISNIWHPNFCLAKDGGAVCSSILKSEYNASVTLHTILNHILYVIQNPNPNNAINAQAAQELLHDKDLYEEHVDQYLYQL